jgi:hypothetical protein
VDLPFARELLDVPPVRRVRFMEEPSSMRRIEEFRPAVQDRMRIHKNEPEKKWRVGPFVLGPKMPVVRKSGNRPE